MKAKRIRSMPRRPEKARQGNPKWEKLMKQQRINEDKIAWDKHKKQSSGRVFERYEGDAQWNS